MKTNRNAILAILGCLVSFYYGFLVLGPDSQNGLLMIAAGLTIFAALLLLLFFPRAQGLAATLLLLSAATNLIINNSIFTSLFPATLGILLISERDRHV